MNSFDVPSETSRPPGSQIHFLWLYMPENYLELCQLSTGETEKLSYCIYHTALYYMKTNTKFKWRNCTCLNIGTMQNPPAAGTFLPPGNIIQGQIFVLETQISKFVERFLDNVPVMETVLGFFVVVLYCFDHWFPNESLQRCIAL